MPADRFYLKENFKENATLEGEEFNHLNRVMRKQIGDVIELVNGMGSLALAKITNIEKRKASLNILETSNHKPALPPLILVQALTKPQKLELIIQKGTELGVSHFIFFPSEKSEKRDLSENQKKRHELICIGAMKQCGRFDLPKLELANDLESLSLPEGNAYFGDLRSEKPLPKGKAPYILFIGPEKGFSEKEHNRLEKRFKAEGIRLHPYILRAETAAIAAVTQVGLLVSAEYPLLQA